MGWMGWLGSGGKGRVTVYRTCGTLDAEPLNGSSYTLFFQAEAVTRKVLDGLTSEEKVPASTLTFFALPSPPLLSHSASTLFDPSCKPRDSLTSRYVELGWLLS